MLLKIVDRFGLRLWLMIGMKSLIEGRKRKLKNLRERRGEILMFFRNFRFDGIFGL